MQLEKGCYQAAYLPASFKGFAVQALEVSSEHGRRSATGEFVFGERTNLADLGVSIRHFHLKFQIATNDHIARANAFIKVCESKGPGILVHPTRGSVRVSCKKLKLSDHIYDAQGVTEGDLEMIEANEWVGSIGGVLGGVLGSAAGLSPLVSAVASYFTSAYDMSAVSILDVAAAQSTAQDAVSQILTNFSSVTGLAADKKVWRIASDLGSVATQSGSVSKTSTAWQAISNGIAAIDTYGTSAPVKFSALRRLVNWASRGSTLPGVGGSAQDAVFSAVRILGAAYIARVGASTAATSSQDACRLYAMVLKVLNEEAAIAQSRCDTTLYLSIRDFTGTAQTALLTRIYDAPALIEYNFNGAVSSLVAAHEIFGDAKRFGELEATNATALPFIMGPTIRAYSAASASG